MKKLNNLLKKTSILTTSTLILVGTALSTTSLSSVNALYNDNNQLVGHGFDALSTKNGLNKPNNGTISRSLVASGGAYKEDWEGSISFSDQNGDPQNMNTISLYPGESFHVSYKIKYVAKSGNWTHRPIPFLGSKDFISFRPEFFDYVSMPKLTATNPATNPSLSMSDIVEFEYNRKQISFSATQIQPGDEFTIDFDLQTVLNLKEKVLADMGEFPFSYSMNSFIRAHYGSKANTETYLADLRWQATEATSTINKKQLDAHTYQMELSNTTKGSLFEQVIHNSMLMDTKNIKITGLEQIHTAKNPVVDYVDLSMNKGTQITTGGTASQAQLDAVNTQLQSGKFVIDEVQEGDKVVVTYQLV